MLFQEHSFSQQEQFLLTKLTKSKEYFRQKTKTINKAT